MDWNSRGRLVSVDAQINIQAAAQLMLRNSRQGLLVIDSEAGEIVGVLQERDFMRALGEHGDRASAIRIEELVG